MAQDSKKKTINLSDLLFYVAVVLKHARLMVLLFSLSLMAGLTYYVYARPLYYAKSLVRVDSVARPLDAETIFKDGTDRELIKQMTSPHVMSRTAKALGYSVAADRDVNARFIQTVAIRFNSEKQMEVQVWSYRPEVAREWTESLVREYQAYRSEQRARFSEGVIKTFTKDMEELRAKMLEQIRDKARFRAENENTKIMVEMNQYEHLPERIALIKRRLQALENVRPRLESPDVDTITKLSLLSALMDKEVTVDVGRIVADGSDQATSKSIVVTPPMVNAGPEPWEELDRKLRELRQQEREMGRTYLPAHPKMKPLMAAIQEVKSSLDAHLETGLNSYNLACANLRSKQAELNAQIPDYEAIVARDQTFKQEFENQQAGNLQLNSIFKQMAQKLSTLDFTQDKERVYLQFMNHMELRDDRPVSPNKLKLVLYSCLLGLGLAIGIPFLIEFLDHTVSNVEQVESAFDLRGLGIVPRIGDEDLKPLPLLDNQGKEDRQLIENFRVIRTNLVLNSGASNPNQVIVIASAMPQEGKTVVSTNLALAFSQMGEKTLLIDADLRRGRIHRIFDMTGKSGLSNVLSENLDWRKVCLPSGRPNLDVMAAGPHLAGATEKFGTEKFETLMKELRGQYQRIVIDTPPVLGLSETSMLQPLVDGVLFVIWSGHTPMRNVKAAVELLQANRAKFFGFVLNRLDLSTATNYYYYYYYSYDYYESYSQLEKA